MKLLLFGPAILALLGGAAWLIALVAARLRGRNLLSGVSGSTYGAARALGATGPDPDRKGAGLTMTHDARRFSLVAGAWSKHRPLELILGTNVRQAEGEAATSAFRSAPASAAPLASMPRIVFRREADVDRWGKRLGLNRELQAADDAFDRAVYVEHEGDAATAEAAIAVPRVRVAVGAALATAPEVVTNSHGQAVALRWPTHDAPGSPAALSDAMARLAAIAEAFPPVTSPALRRRPWLPPGRLALMLGMLIVVGGIGIAALVIDGVGPVDSVFVLHAGALSAAFLVLALLAGWLVSRGRPRGLARFGGIALSTMALAPALALGGLGLVNARSVVERPTVEATVVARTRTKSRKRGDRCSVTLSPWREGLVARPRAAVHCGTWSTIAVGDRVDLSLARGRLGYEWIEAVTPRR